MAKQFFAISQKAEVEVMRKDEPKELPIGHTEYLQEPVLCENCGNLRFWKIRCEYCGLTAPIKE